MRNIASQNLVDLLLDAVCVVDAQGCFVFVSAAFERIFGYTPDEAVGMQMINLVHPDDRERTLHAAQNIMAGSLQLHFENRYLHKNGQVVHVRWTARWVNDKQLRVAVAHDITERKRAEAVHAAIYEISEASNAAQDLPALLERIHAILGALLATGCVAVALFDAERNTLNLPPFHRERTDASPTGAPVDTALLSEWVHASEPLLLTAGFVETLPEPFQRLASALPAYWLGVPLPSPGSPLGALVLWNHDPAIRHGEQDQELLQYVASHVGSAIERKQMQARLQRMAQYDQLTHLPNRALFLDRLKTALARARREQTALSLLFIDLDRFKEVNDTLGHAMGDLLLQRVAQRLLECVRGADTVARLGGDEFVVLLESGHLQEHAQAIAEKILAAFDLPFDLEGTPLRIHPSIGVATALEHGLDERHLLSQADAAMYQSKKRGGNRVHLAWVPGSLAP